MTPKTLFRRLATAEAITWALLLAGMVLKYVTRTTDLGVRVGGMLHGVVFISYVLVTMIVWTNQRWSTRTGLLALASAVPPFATVLFDRRAEGAGLLEGPWRLGVGGDVPTNPAERLLAWAIRTPALAALVVVVAVACLTGVALLIGPPTQIGG